MTSIKDADRKTLILVGIIALCIILYIAIIIPKNKQIKTLEVEQQQLIMKEEENNDTILVLESSLSAGDTDTGETVEKKEFKSIADRYYINMEQQDIIVLLDTFVPHDANDYFVKGDMIFTTELIPLSTAEGFDATLPMNNITVDTITIGYVSDYGSLTKYIRNVNNNKKIIDVKSVSINPLVEMEQNPVINLNNPEEETGLALVPGQTGELVLGYENQDKIKGEIVLEIAQLPMLESVGFTDDGRINQILEGLSQGTTNDPFTPYNGFITPEIIALEPTDNNEVVTPVEEIRKTKVYDFESKNYFFISDPKDVNGFVTRSNQSTSGSYSMKLFYEFINGNSNNTAYAIFEDDSVVLKSQVKSLYIDLYTKEYFTHQLGIIVRDASGKEHNVNLIDSINETGWNQMVFVLPSEISYPCVIKGFYVQDKGIKDKLTGEILFDNLEVEYETLD